MVSMKDVAARCGVSVATVSKALNGHSDIGSATAERVRECAREMGYFPNSSARALKTNRSFDLGVLFVDPTRNGLTQDYFAHVLESFKVTAEARGYDLTFISCDRTARHMTYLEHCRYRGLDGVVIACVDFEDEEVAQLIRSEIPVVTIDHSFENKPSVISDNVGGMRDLVTGVAGYGHRRIAYITGGATAVSSVTRNRIGSFYRTMTGLGLDVPEAYVRDGEYRNPSRCRELALELLSLPDPPTCILAPDDLSAIGILQAARERGLRVPEELSFAGYDGISAAKYLTPALCTIEQDTAAIGRIAAEKLIAMIEHPKTFLIDRTVVPGKFLHGASVAAPAV